MLSASNLKLALGALVAGLISSVVSYAADPDIEGERRRSGELRRSNAGTGEELMRRCGVVVLARSDSTASTVPLSDSSGDGARDDGSTVGAPNPFGSDVFVERQGRSASPVGRVADSDPNEGEQRAGPTGAIKAKVHDN